MRMIGRIALQIVPGLILLWFASAYVERARIVVSHFDGDPTDGPFQIYNAMRRMDTGQMPGRDFPAFHGVGVPWLHWPPYRLLGGGLRASELARQVITPLATIIVYALVSTLLTESLWPAVIWGALSFFALPSMLGNLVPLDRMMTAGTSLYGLRGLAPLLAIALLWRGGSLAAGVALAASCLLGIEQGVFLIVAILVTAIALWLVRRGRVSYDGSPLARSLMLGVAFGLAGLWLATGGDQAAALRYYFVDIPRDQVWYFGVPPNDFLGSGQPDNAKRMIYVAITAGVFVLGWLTSLFFSRRASDSNHLRGSTVFAVGCLYGALTLTSSFGIFRPHEFYHLAARVVILLVTAWAYRQISARLGAERISSSPITGIIASVAAIGLAFFVFRHVMAIVRADKPLVLSDRWNKCATDFSGKIRAQFNEPQTGNLWSTYASIVEDRLGIFHPREDYIIHALDEMRPTYIADFAKLQPMFVQTMRRDTFKYEEWLQTTTWGFYQRLLDNYEIVAQSEFSLLWQRTKERWREPAEAGWTKLTLPPDADRVTVPVNDPKANLAVVRLEYEAIMPWKKLPLIGQQPRFLVAMPDSRSAYPASLPPRETMHEFPVPLNPGRPFTLEFQIRGIAPGAELRINSVSVRYLTIPEVNLPFLNPTK